jgi:hypothetical protein
MARSPLSSTPYLEREHFYPPTAPDLDEIVVTKNVTKRRETRYQSKRSIFRTLP